MFVCVCVRGGVLEKGISSTMPSSFYVVLSRFLCAVDITHLFEAWAMKRHEEEGRINERALFWAYPCVLEQTKKDLCQN